MKTHAVKKQENKSPSVTNSVTQKKSGAESTFQFVDNRPEAIVQRKLQEIANNSPQTKQAAKLQAMANTYTAQHQQPIQKKENNTGLPDNLKSGIENLSGYSMDDVKVHYNSDKPAQLQAHAYAQGTDIHLASGQEKHLPHEAWHVVQQKQGRVKPTIQMKGKVNINDDARLEKEADVIGTSLKNGNESISNRQSNEQPFNNIKHANVIQGYFYNSEKENLIKDKVFQRLENLALNYWFPDKIDGMTWLGDVKKIGTDEKVFEDFVPWLEKTVPAEDLDDLLEAYEVKFGLDLKTEGKVKIMKDEEGEKSQFIIDLTNIYPKVYEILSQSESAYKHIIEAGKKGVVLGKTKLYQERADEANRALTHANEIYIPSSQKDPLQVADAIIFEIFNSLGAEERSALSKSDKKPEEIADYVIDKEIHFYEEKLKLLKEIPDMRIAHLGELQQYDSSQKVDWFKKMIKSHGSTQVVYKGQEMTIRESYTAMASGK
jgi:hypothetical protein